MSILFIYILKINSSIVNIKSNYFTLLQLYAKLGKKKSIYFFFCLNLEIP